MANENEIGVALTVEDRQAIKALNRLVKATEKYEKTAEKGFGKANTAFKNFAGNLAAMGVSKIFSTIGSSASAAFDAIADSTIALEATENQFATLTGSVESAQEVIQDLQQFTASTPFQFPGVAKTAQQLLSFGFETKELVPILSELGDAAAASGTPIGELGLIFGQISAAGKLTGERLLQLQERAIPIGPAIKKVMGDTGKSVKDMVSAGEVDFATFRKAFETLNDEGGIFFEATIRQSKTLGGVLSTLGDNADILASDIGAAFLPIAKTVGVEAIAAMQALSGSVKDNQAAFKLFAKDGVIFLVDAFEGLLNVTDVVGRAFMILFDTVRIVVNEILRAGVTMLSSIVTLANGVANLIPGIKTKFGGLTEALQTMTESMGDTTIGFAKSIAKNATETGKLGTAATEVGAFSDQLTASLNKQTVAVEENAAAKEAAALREKKAAEEKMAAKQAEVDFTVAKEAELTALLEQKTLKEQELAALKAEENTLGDEAKLLNLQTQLQREQEIKTLADEADKARAAKTSEDISKIQLAASSRELKQKAAAAKAVVSVENAKNKSMVGIAQNAAALINAVAGEGSKAGFIIAKGAALAQVAISRGLALAAVPAQTAAIPFPGNLAAAGTMTGLINTNAALQAATIAATAIKGFETGGIIPGASFTGDSNIIAANSGEMVLTKSQQAQLFSQANGGGQSGQGNISAAISNLASAINSQPVVIEIEGEAIARTVRNVQLDGFAI